MALLCLAAPAHAQDAVDWGGTGCKLVAVQDRAHVAEVTCWNRLTTGNWVTEGIMTAGDVVVSVSAIHGPGDDPDSFTFTAPGFIMQPGSFDLEEHTQGVALVFPWSGM
jgi:hypothetical protein